MFKCPNCYQYTINKSSKFWIGPIRSIKCSNCNAKVSVPFMSLFLTTIYILMMYFIPRLDLKLVYIISILTVTCISYIYLFYKFVPLEVKLKKEDKRYKTQKNKNILILIGYFVITFGIIFLWK